VSSELVANCSRCKRTLLLVVVDSFDDPLTDEQEAAARDYAGWYETFDESEDAWIAICGDCVTDVERAVYRRVGDG
jgi:hypothetical protein